MTQEAMAEALFVTRQTVSNYENGRSRPDLDMLLKIAEVLETDVTALLYGPPISQSKKGSYRRLLLSGLILVAVTVLYAALSILAPSKSIFGYQYAIRSLKQLTVLPVVMFVLGWILTHCLSIFCNLQPLQAEKVKVPRLIIGILLGIFVLIPIPYIIFHIVACYRSFVYQSVSMSFPYIPILQELFYAIFFIITKVPFVYSILGSIFWLLGLPPTKKKSEG